MAKYYQKRKHVPDRCPDCGLETKPFTGGIENIVKQFWGGYNKCLVERRPGWGIPCWEGVCGACMFRSEMTDTSPL